MEPTQTFGRRGLASPAPLPRLAVARKPETASEAGAAPKTFPILTISLSLLLALIFLGETASGLTDGPGQALGYLGLTAVGGVGRRLVAAGEAWRIVTAPLLHASLPHLIGNLFVLLLAGTYLERLVGWAWLGAIFTVSALGGVLGSLLLNDPNTVSVGASGAIMGVLAAVVACSFHVGAHDQRNRLRWIGARLMIPALVPFGAAAGMAVDYNAHLGGAVAGGLMGFALLSVAWPENEARPGLRRVAGGVGVAGLAAAAVSFLFVGLHFAPYATRARALAPDSLLARTKAERAARSQALVLRYPHDPRTHGVRADYFKDINDLVDEEVELKAALAEHEVLARDLPPTFAWGLELRLAGLLLNQHRQAEARVVVQPVCAAVTKAPMVVRVQALLRSNGMCRR